MITTARALRFIVATAALPLLAGPLTASAAAVRKPVAKAGAAVKVDNAIIALPLNPIVAAGKRLCAARTASGLGYTVLRPAAGGKPAQADVALVNYVGFLATTGAVFDQGMRSPLPVDGVIPGFSEGLRLTPKGGVVRLCIPAALGYGARESGPIPANSDLVFQVELIDYKTAAEVEAMKNAPAEAAPKP